MNVLVDFVRLNCYILIFLLQKQIRETTDEDSDESDTEDGRKVRLCLFTENSYLQSLLAASLVPQSSQKLERFARVCAVEQKRNLSVFF